MIWPRPSREIEKEFILNAVMEEKIRLLLIAGACEWPVLFTGIDDDEIVLSHTMPLRLLRRQPAL